MKNIKAGHTRPIICLDAGHYGKYNRSPGVPAYYESEMNWKLQQLLKGQLELRGMEVKTTRTNKAKDLGLYKRGEASKGCDLFISIHSNAVGGGMNEKVDHPVGIYLVENDDTNIDEMSREVAVLLSNKVAEVMQTAQKAKQYSKRTSKDLNGDGEDNDNYYGVLHGAQKVGTAAIILEHSFHTNTRATNWLLDEDNLAKLAKAEADVLADYFGVEEKTPAQPVPEKSEQPAEVKVDAARSFTKSYAGAYRVKSSTGLNLRAGASTNKAVLETMPNGSSFRCYGYHTGNWLYGVSASGKTGFCSKAYLVKK